VVYLDANLFVYAITHDPSEHPKARAATAILARMVTGELRAVTSFLTWDEVVWVVWRLTGLENAIRAGRALLTLRNLNFIKVDLQIILKSQELVAKYGLKPRDAIHAATALVEGEREIVSDDKELDVVREIRRIPLVGD
jgi:hypothetical protein